MEGVILLICTFVSCINVTIVKAFCSEISLYPERLNPEMENLDLHNM